MTAPSRSTLEPMMSETTESEDEAIDNARLIAAAPSSPPTGLAILGGLIGAAWGPSGVLVGALVGAWLGSQDARTGPGKSPDCWTSERAGH